MNDAWSSASRLESGIGPYAHWWKHKEKPNLPAELRGDLKDLQFSFRGTASDYNQGKKVENSLYEAGAVVPLNSLAANPLEEREEWADENIKDRLPGGVPADTVITGILDTGVALSHMSTNIEARETRIISSWIQGATMEFDNNAMPTDPWLPCGREVFSSDINAALTKFGDENGVVDEEAFNRDLKISSPDLLMGNRDLEMAAAHGTHTLSLAAGLDPLDTKKEELERQRIIAVNLPAQYSHGSGGNFLPYFAVYGVDRILHIADALWFKNSRDPERKKIRGYPIVINFSYGMMAGPKDGYHIIELALKNLFDDREKRAKAAGQIASPVRIVMPVGNDNLRRGAASIVLGAEGVTFGQDNNLKARQSIKLPWRIQPADATANFLEIWSEAKQKDVFDNMLSELRVFVSPPGSKKRLQVNDLTSNSFSDLKDFARVYVQHVSIDSASGATTHATEGRIEDSNVRHRLALLVCTAPTTLDLAEAPLAPAGEWTVEVEYEGCEPVDFTFFVQSDQSAVVTSKSGRRSYFDHKDYRTHLTEHHNGHLEESGAVADTYSFDETNSPSDNDNWYKYGPVQRRGTHNAISSLSDPEMIAVGSFDDANGYPTAYSATTDGNPQLDYDQVNSREKNVGPYPENNGRKIQTVCYPGENAPSLFGLLGSGSRDGSIVGSRGTSMSTALATREAVKGFLESDQADWHVVGSQDWFRDLSRESEAEQQLDSWGQELAWPIPGDEGVLKLGSGRVSDPRKRTVHRLGGDAVIREEET